MARVLIIDDDTVVCDMLALKLGRLGHETVCRHTVDSGLQQVRSASFDVVYLDVQLPDGNGLDILPKVKQTDSAPEVIIITGKGDPDGAKLAIGCGAWDYITKASSLDAMTLPLLRALQYREGRQAAKAPVALDLEGIVGNSLPMKRCYDRVAQAAASDANVLLTGETGTGKELFASAIHRNSARSGCFVIVDCAALPDSLVESMLFGHVKGAFTGAGQDSEGLILQANGGTLFLDEVGELPMSLQKAFLRVLQERRFRPVGGRSEVASDFRLIAATNRNLDDMVAKGQFREDLLYRLRSISIELPPLRERRDDIKMIAMQRIAMLCEKHGTATKGFSPELFEVLTNRDWPGNVRELLQTMDSVFASASQAPTLYPQDLPTHIRVEITAASLRDTVSAQPAAEQKAVGETDRSQAPISLPKLADARETAIAETERGYLGDLMTLTNGDMDEASQVSGLSVPRLYALLKKHNVPRA